MQEYQPVPGYAHKIDFSVRKQNFPPSACRQLLASKQGIRALTYARDKMQQLCLNIWIKYQTATIYQSSPHFHTGGNLQLPQPI